MKMMLYALRDVKADSFTVPVAFTRDELAVREVGQMIAHKQGDPGKYPADFSLYRIGSFDSSSGELKSLQIPELVASCLSMVPKDDPRQIQVPGTEVIA